MTDPSPGPFDVLVLGSGVAGLSAALRLVALDRAACTTAATTTPRTTPTPRTAAPRRVAVLTKGALEKSTTRWAQGGVAAVLGGDEDSTDLHLADTLAAGADLCDVHAVRVLVDEGPQRVEELIALGVQFDREASGTLALAREGGHSRARVVHAGGLATGAEMERALVEATRRSVSAVLEGWFALDLLVDGGRCRGVLAATPQGAVIEVPARHVVLATGGAGQLFSVTTNPSEATGDGLAMALRAGVPVADVEFVQFHPTALHHPAMPRPLLSEALRGHGALLRDARGERFVDELAPRDVVSRAMAARMVEQGVDHLWLDATALERFGERFPTIQASLAEAGLDPATDWLPIAPAAHHLSGGVLTDLSGATAMPGLWAAGETACTGVHGANRLASNSLLEGMVFGARLAEAIHEGRDGPGDDGALAACLGMVPDPDIPGRPVDDEWSHVGDERVPAPGPGPGTAGRGLTGRNGSLGPTPEPGPEPARAGDVAALSLDPITGTEDVPKLRAHLQRAMTAGAGVVRDRASLAAADEALAAIATALEELEEATVAAQRAPGGATVAAQRAPGGATVAAQPATGAVSTAAATRTGTDPTEAAELANLVTVARAVVRAAAARTESRGAHTRRDFPETDPRWRCRLLHGSVR